MTKSQKQKPIIPWGEKYAPEAERQDKTFLYNNLKETFGVDQLNFLHAYALLFESLAREEEDVQVLVWQRMVVLLTYRKYKLKPMKSFWRKEIG